MTRKPEPNYVWQIPQGAIVFRAKPGEFKGGGGRLTPEQMLEMATRAQKIARDYLRRHGEERPQAGQAARKGEPNYVWQIPAGAIVFRAKPGEFAGGGPLTTKQMLEIVDRAMAVLRRYRRLFGT